MRCFEWVTEQLAQGPRPMSEILDAGVHAGFERRHVRACALQLGVESVTMWALPHTEPFPKEECSDDRTTALQIP